MLDLLTWHADGDRVDEATGLAALQTAGHAMPPNPVHEGACAAPKRAVSPRRWGIVLDLLRVRRIDLTRGFERLALRAG